MNRYTNQLKIVRYLSLGIISLLLFGMQGCKDRGEEDFSLAGKWFYKLDPKDEGIDQKWFDTSFDKTLKLPGSLASNDLGDAISSQTVWTGQIVDSAWWNSDRYKTYREPNEVKIPFWLQPTHKYTGAAWYQKEIEIPSGWSNEALFLNLERCHWETELWVNGIPIGKENSLSTPHRYYITGAIKKGKNTLTLKVDNRVKEIDPGCNSHSITDHTQSNWNGIVGKIYIEKRNRVYVDQVQVYPNVAEKNIRVAVTINNTSKHARASHIWIHVKGLEIDGNEVYVFNDKKLDSGKTVVNMTYPMGKDMKLWNEFHPNIYKIIAGVENEMEGRDSTITQFGIRDIGIDGTQITVNNVPIFLRGTLECAVFPKTGYPATDEKSWRERYKKIKEFGLNHVRFHSWCPPEAAFTAADKAGVYLQVECASWANTTSSVGDGAPIDSWLYKEGESIIEKYGNHPSFIMMAYGNEPAGASQVQYLGEFETHFRNLDSRRIYSSASGWPAIEANDYHVTPVPRIQGWGEELNSIINSQKPNTMFDWNNRIVKDRPTVSHEVGQWCAFPDFTEINRYTGVLKAKNFEIFKDFAKEHNLLSLSKDLLYGSGHLQTLCYKADIEAALRTPGFGGFQLLGLSDFPGQGTALVGVLNAFWKEKGYVTGEEFSHFCNTTVPLARFEKRVFRATDSIVVETEVAHFGKEPLKKVTPKWRFIDSRGNIVKKGTLPTTDLPISNGIKLGIVKLAVNDSLIADQYRFELSVGDFTNSWNLWVYPIRRKELPKVDIVQRITPTILDSLKAGGRAILSPKQGTLAPKYGGTIGMGFSTIFWNTAWTRGQKPETMGIICDPFHEALRQFPTEKYADWQWWDALSHGAPILLDSLSEKPQPIVRVIDDWFQCRNLALITEVKVGKGKLIIIGTDLMTGIKRRLSAQELLYSLDDYIYSNDCNPTVELKDEELLSLVK